ncbi:MAG: hypothetical protein Ta2E_13100 [Mycoplasmoidaceae bacterium]|nr:MAG: hypothetical protein Ta2E_13100 [Mycoplasmoidaceae bacterium]
MEIFVKDFKNIDNTKTKTISSYPYYLILINLKTYFATLKHLDDKTSDSVLSALKSMFNKIKGVSLESNEYKSFV